MKKVASFSIGDKVFAKVKGYPPWPATITEDHTTKFNVRFYGTGETGVVKSKDLFYYLKHKKSFLKQLKRKDYNEAIEEIESAIKECGGTDGNAEETVAEAPTPSEHVENTVNMKKKRKRSQSSDKANGNIAKKLAEDSISSADSASEVSPNEKTPKKAVPERSPRKLKGKGAALSNAVKEEITTIPSSSETDLEKPPENDENKNIAKENKEKDEEHETATAVNDQELIENSLTAADFKMVTTDYLDALVSYADYLKKDEDKYKKNCIETRQQFENELVLAKIPSGKYVGIKYNRDTPPSLSNEFDRAVYDANEAKTVLSLVKLLEEGKCDPESDQDRLIRNINIDEEQIERLIRVELSANRKERIEQLHIESNFVELDAKIKKCLGLDKAQPKEALQYLNEMLTLNLNPLMMKKHPHVVEMVKRLGRYIGNVSEWNFSKEQLEEFEVEAESVRKKAEEVFSKFAVLFNVSDETTLWKVFSDELVVFKDLVKDMSESELFCLAAEPNSRQHFLDKCENVEELKLLLANEQKIQENDNDIVKIPASDENSLST